MNDKTVLLNINNKIAYVILNRPNLMNSFNTEMHEELSNILDEVQDNKNVKALILKASGKGFCAGQDLNDSSVAPNINSMPNLGIVVENYYKPLIMKINNLRIPTIAAVHGVAAGAGVSIALACDFIIASSSAKFILAFSKIGLIPDSGASWFLPKKIGLARALGVAMLGDKIDSKTAEDWGMIWKSVNENEFDNYVEDLANKLANLPTQALYYSRQLIRSSPMHSLEDHLTAEGKAMSYLGFSKDYIEGINAFFEKRQPNFTGE